MIWLNPRRVTIGGAELGHVSLVSVDRTSDRVVVEYSDVGPQVAFVDVPERRVTIRIERAVVSDGDAPVRPGDASALSFRTAPSASGAGAREVSASVVVTSVDHEFGVRKGAVQRIQCVAVSPDGVSDPVTETPVGGP